MKTLNGYSQDFVDQAKCKEIALNTIAQGSQAVVQVAGGCGLGALDAAKEKGIWGIGADQSFLGPYILTSALKNDGIAVLTTIKTVQDGTFVGGQDVVFEVASGAAGLGKISSKVPHDIGPKVRAKEKAVAAGQVASIPTTSSSSAAAGAAPRETALREPVPGVRPRLPCRCEGSTTDRAARVATRGQTPNGPEHGTMRLRGFRT